MIVKSIIKIYNYKEYLVYGATAYKMFKLYNKYTNISNKMILILIIDNLVLKNIK